MYFLKLDAEDSTLMPLGNSNVYSATFPHTILFKHDASELKLCR